MVEDLGLRVQINNVLARNSLAYVILVSVTLILPRKNLILLFLNLIDQLGAKLRIFVLAQTIRQLRDLGLTLIAANLLLVVLMVGLTFFADH